MGNEFKGAGAVKCGRCDGTGECRTCKGDGSRKPTEAYLEKRRLALESEAAEFAAYRINELDRVQRRNRILEHFPENWMDCNACKNQSGICPGCNGKGWVKVEPSTFGRSSEE